MNPPKRQLTDRIKALARAAGFDLCGIAKAAPMPRADFFHNWLAGGYAGTLGYLHRHTGSRVDVRVWLPWAKSVIVVGLNYGQPKPHKPTDEPRGRVAMYAWGDDYHAIMKEKLRDLVAAIGRERTGDHGEAAKGESTADPSGDLYGEKNRGSWEPAGRFRYKTCVDTSAITERELAAAAGVGWIGKNTLVLNESHGSYFFLGEIITDLDLAPDPMVVDHCGSCTRCLDACPTQAFPQPYVMDASRCISYLTIEFRKDIDPALAAKMGDWLYGCDICQEVCPFNKRAPETREDRLRPERGRTAREDAAFADADSRDAGPATNLEPLAIDAVYPKLGDIAEWDDSRFRAAVAGKASERAMLRMWQRNAAIAKENAAVAGAAAAVAKATAPVKSDREASATAETRPPSDH